MRGRIPRADVVITLGLHDLPHPRGLERQRTLGLAAHAEDGAGPGVINGEIHDGLRLDRVPLGGACTDMHQELFVLPRIPDRMDQGGAIGFGDPQAHQAWGGEKSVESRPRGGSVASDSTNRDGHAPASLGVMARTLLQRRPATSLTATLISLTATLIGNNPKLRIISPFLPESV